ncbi:hypothetical protein ACQ86N_42110 [Puia sp. P3]|uniref:hypothetical protein n=1 Tax=Puia sp. P3 TaxID=3423952 RepID=UPI003D66E9B0
MPNSKRPKAPSGRPEANYMAALETVRGNKAGVASAKANLTIAAKNLSRTTVVSPSTASSPC